MTGNAVELEFERMGGKVTVRGSVDLVTAPRLREALAEAASAGGALCVDLNDVDYFDSAGIAVLYEFAGSGLELSVAPNSIVARVLQIGGLAEVATVREIG